MLGGVSMHKAQIFTEKHQKPLKGEKIEGV